jgi:LacI family transcriptional regulator
MSFTDSDNSHHHISLRDIARRAGISHAAVSMALRNHPRISVQTISRIKKIAREMGYSPDFGLANLMGAIRRKSPSRPVIALVTDWDSPSPWKWHDYTRHFYTAITERAGEHGFEIQEFWVRERAMTAKRLNCIWQTRGIAGLIVPPIFSKQANPPFNVERLAVATHGRPFSNAAFHSIEPNHLFNTILSLKEMTVNGG